MNAKFVLGLAMILGGLVLGAYVGVWVCFIGGIVDVITEIRAEELSAMAVAIGVAKVVFSGACGALSAYLLIIPGLATLNAS